MGNESEQQQPQPEPEPEPAPDVSWVKEVDIRHDATKEILGRILGRDSGGQSSDGD